MMYCGILVRGTCATFGGSSALLQIGRFGSEIACFLDMQSMYVSHGWWWNRIRVSFVLARIAMVVPRGIRISIDC